MNQPLVSVIVVSYNHEHFIRENLESIKRQSYNNIELIVGDDASLDKSIETFDMWLAENNVSAKKNYHSTNTGLATMLNECLVLAEGHYVKIIAADDFLHVDYIGKCVDNLIRTKLKAVITDAFSVNNNSKVISDEYFSIPHYTSQLEMTDLLMHYNFVPGSTLFLSKDVFEKVGMYPTNTILEDYNFALRMASANLMIGVIRESLVYYRRHDNNQTIRRVARLQMERIKEQILFDKLGNYGAVVATNILREIVAGNASLFLVKSLYRNYKGANKKVMFGLRYPKLYQSLFRLKMSFQRKTNQIMRSDI